ncbi:NAD(P)H-dependent flavin oxidoreductase [Effusibacillus dendaii]|uniref:Probable nitronate monooxygenase n=1 Tax=Effusibacillus dendaii TaxID=2743772 RepID=A0A7I8D6Q3_9BACL|nr:DUF561 domain-containing protein [Effusibacillus dendaii]BCJ85062.1 nitronate monooxygenase [Effusibacillus dendaii]
MWRKTKIAEILGISYPIIQAGMAGGPTTPQLVAAVSEAGGLGTLGAGYMTPEQIRSAVREIRKLTDRPFAVNLFVDEPPVVLEEQLAKANQQLDRFRKELGIELGTRPSKYAESYPDQLAAVIEEKVPVFSFTFGIPSQEQMKRLQENGIVTVGTATTVREAVQLEQVGVDLIVGQGSEAGGHRGTFLAPVEHSLVGTLALVPQIVDAVQIPVIAAGGIMDGRGVAAALALGAEGAQLGTAFLACPESGAHPAQKAALLNSTDESTVLTTAFSGRTARGIRNRMITEMESHRDTIAPYPVQNALTRDIRQAAARQNKTDYMSLWAGQASRLTTTKPAADLFADLVRETEEVLRKISQ